LTKSIIYKFMRKYYYQLN